jgi:proteasome lid subunit RPN8/RPN11
VFASKLHDLLVRSAPLVVVDGRLWDELIAELAERGRGERESGAFLLGQRHANGRARRILGAVYYDELDERSLTGGISFDGAAYGRLWDACAEKGLGVVADVHTHPGPWVAQSSIDRAHPMIAQAGHIALIVPDFARRPAVARKVGVHEYLGDGRWRSSLGSAAARRLRIERTRSWWR